MATYVYETVDASKPIERFELKQSMKDDPLTQHPYTGAKIRRVISGGYGYAAKGGGSAPAPSSGGSCGTGCGCH